MSKISPKKSQTLTAELLWQIERVGSPSLSPDGAQAVVSVTKADAQANTSSSHLWLLSTLGGEPRQLTRSGDKDSSPAWSPTGEWVAFCAKRQQESEADTDAQIYLIAPDGGEAKRVTQVPGGVVAFKWFPDGKHIAFSAWVDPSRKLSEQADARAALKARKDTAFVTEDKQYRHWDHNIEPSRAVHLHVLDVQTGKVFDLFEGTALELLRTEHDANHFDVSPDNLRIAFVHDPATVKLGDNCTTITEITVNPNAAKRSTRTLTERTGHTHSAPRYNANGEQLACLRAHTGKRHTAQDQLVVIDCASLKAQTLCADWDRTPLAPLKWLGDTQIAFRAEDFGRTHLWQVGLGDVQPQTLAVGGTVMGFDVAAEQLVWQADAMDHPARIHTRLIDCAGAAPSRIEAFNDLLLAGVVMGGFESITYKGAACDAPAFNKAGHTAQMWLVYPPNFDSSRKYPLMHSIHGGPHTASGDTFHYRWNNQVFAAQGYVVACVNYHGSTSFGYAFMDSITHRWGELELQDVEAATDLLVKKPFIDKTRLFATGGSYGGYMVAWMNGHLKQGRYQAYVCHAGCWDWVSMFSDDAWHWHHKELGAFYFNDMAKIHAQSPHAHAKNLTTPTLVIHGQLDYRVPDAQGLAYYNTLKAQDVAARLVWFPDENHWILKPANSLLWHREFFAWLRRFDPAHAPATGGANSRKSGKGKAQKA